MKILILSARLPYPQNTGAKIRAFQIMKALAKKHQVTLLTFYGDASEEKHFSVFEEMGVKLVPLLRPDIDKPIGAAHVVRGIISGLPYTVVKYQDARMSGMLKNLLLEHDAVHCEHMHMATYLDGVKNKLKILDGHNVEAQIAERLVPLEKNSLKKFLLFINHKAMYRFERNICLSFNLVLAVSEQDSDWYKNVYGACNVRVLENGVDLDYFHKAPDGISERIKLVFVGMMGWMPNSDGSKYFVSEILPLIKNRYPDVVVDLVGKDPPESVLKLKDVKGVNVTGMVDDVRPYVWDSQVYIVPLRFGGGTRLKILEAFAMNKPVVSTSLGCEGIMGKNENELLIADSPLEFADAVTRLLSDRELREKLAANAARLAASKYSWKSLGDKLLLFYKELKNIQSDDNKLKEY
ncbi:MAG: glycosyltransferase [Nitrospirae bacterium]|nr:glycosyltransferase [Nitrospirota bacterium]